MQHHSILRIVTKFNLPLILLFALYVQFHGDFGPGGGFQAGVLAGAALILFTLVFGLEAAERVAPPVMLRLLSAAGVLLYAGVGVVNMALGSNFLDYGSLIPAHPPTGEHYGILAIELGVGITVSSSMALIFFAFSGRAATHESPLGHDE